MINKKSGGEGGFPAKSPQNYLPLRNDSHTHIQRGLPRTFSKPIGGVGGKDGRTEWSPVLP